MQLTLPKKFLAQVDAIILDNISNESFTIDDLSNLLHLSNSQVYRKIKEKSGMNPSTYIKTKRLKKAHQLILKTERTITDIAYSVGFNCNTYFSTCFSEYYGFPPSQLRKKWKISV